MATSKMTALRIKPEDLEHIDANAQAAGMSRTAWMIEAALHYQRPDRDSELDAIHKRLNRLEQLAGLD